MKQLRANLLLLLTAIIWGAAFVAQSVSMDYIGPFTFLFSRSILGGAVLLPLIAVLDRRKKARQTPERDTNARKNLLIGGLCCGAALFAASSFQQFGMKDTTAGKSGFITAMYVVLVPVFGLFFGRKPARKTWGAVLAALAGMYLLCLYGTGLEGLNRGDGLEMVCALGFTAQIMLVDHFAPKVDGVKLSCIQFFVCGVLAGIGMLLFETPDWAGIRAAAVPILYAGILSSGVGYTLQIVAQKDTQPVVASLLMSLESVFSLIFSWILLREAMSAVELLGCTLMFAAIIWVQLPEKKKAAEPIGEQ